MKKRWECAAFFKIKEEDDSLYLPLGRYWTRSAAQREADRLAECFTISRERRDSADALLRFRAVHVRT